MTDKITEAHRSRAAYVYVRQSTQFQVQHNLESQRCQYALADRAKELGWSQVEIVDEDLGRSGSGSVARKGFERLVAAVCLGQVGAVLSLEASRLARNNRDWHHLVDICSLTGTLLIDQEGVYEPRQLNDRLLLGLKGTMSEFELGLFRQRSTQALKEKAKRGELFTKLPVGYVRAADDRCEKNPDRRIQQALQTVFEKFEQMGSVRQVLLWLRQEEVLLPSLEYGRHGRRILWRLPGYSALHNFLKNPIYAGAYAYGRTGTQTCVVEGRARKRRGVERDPERCSVLIRDHHEGYITWKQFERNQAQMRENASMKGLMQVKGAARGGKALLAGLLRCGRCGRKFHVNYSGKESIGRYECRGPVNHMGPACQTLGARWLDAAIEEKVLEVIEPAAIEAAIRAAEQAGDEQDERRRAKELALEQARYEADRAFRQFDAIEPENRLVAAELEGRWNKALDRVKALEKELAESPLPKQGTGEVDRDRLLALAQDLPKVWFDEGSEASLKKRILRALIEGIVVKGCTTSEHVEMTLHWAGGQHSAIKIRRNRPGHHRYHTDKETVELIRELAEVLPDKQIARMLNRLGRKTGHGNSWKEARIPTVRSYHGIPVHNPQRQREKGLINMHEAAQRLGISPMSVRRLLTHGILPARQVVPYAPWVIDEKELGTPAVQAAVENIKKGKRVPLPEDPKQKTLSFQ